MTTISFAELRFGVVRMPDGKRKNDFAAQIELVLEVFKDRTVEFSIKAAKHLAQIAGEKNGEPATAPDAYIAAIAAAHDFVVSTRIVGHFNHACVTVINPRE